MSKQILHGIQAQQALLKGVSTVADAVKGTIGPRGRNVIFDKGYGVPTITNDGVSVAKEIILADTIENMGASIIKEVAVKTNDTAGDGTTTSIILCNAIITEGMKYIAKGANGILVRQGIEQATQDATNILATLARTVNDPNEIKQVATISAESEELGIIIAETIQTIGTDGVVTVEESHGVGVTSTVTSGMKFEGGYVTHHLVTDKERMEAVHTNVAVLVTEGKLSSIQDIVPLMEKLAASGKKELIVIAEDIEGEALGTIILNKMKGIFTVLAIKAPGFAERKRGEIEDIAVSVGATIVTSALSVALQTGDMSVLGTAEKVVSTKDSTIITGGAAKKSVLDTHIQAIKTQITMVGDSKLDAFTKVHLQKRIARLSNGIAVIKVSAPTESEMRYLKLKIEDAVHATKAAIEEGIVAGGGTALTKVSALLQKNVTDKTDYMRGYQILLDALVCPLQQIILNTGNTNAKNIVTMVHNTSAELGFDATTDPSLKTIQLVDMISHGIIDPVKVTRTALQNAASAAGILLTTDVAIADDEETVKRKLDKEE